MHIIFGGAFNGKRQFVKERLSERDIVWHEGTLPEAPAPLTVIAGVEQWVREKLESGLDEEEILRLAMAAAAFRTAGRQVWVLTDISRGLVPADPLERQLRDVTGRLYQALFREAAHITRIWYGIPQKIKGADEDEDLYENRG